MIKSSITSRIPDDLSDDERKVLEKAQRGAHTLEEFYASSVLATSSGKMLGAHVDAAAYKILRDEFIADAGQPADPLEVLMLDQLLWAHHQVGSLHVQASKTNDAAIAEAYSNAAVKLMAESRRTVMALREYRSPVRSNLTVGQQNVAAGGQQLAVITPGDAVRQASGKDILDSELGTNGVVPINGHSRTTITSATRRPSESIETNGSKSRRPAKVG
jgi:hypothetical protein